MIDVVGISFKQNGQIYYFSPKNLILKQGTNVIVESENGLQYGFVEKTLFQIPESKLKSPLKSVVRIADKEDKKKAEKNKIDAHKALEFAKKLSEKLNLKIFIIDANYTFDRDKLLFRFLSDSRVDFRDLAKELASKYRTRIELRQIGARDKAKEVGGCGQCGRPICCGAFLSNIDSVSVNMAKNQNVSLNPNKINGVCGRLLCCLTYENDVYCEFRKDLPKIGQVIKTEHGTGKVTELDILNKKYKVDIPEYGIVEVTNASN